MSNLKYLIAVTVLIGMASVQSLPIQRMTRSSSSESSANDSPIIIARSIRKNLIDGTINKSRGLLPMWGSAIYLAEEDILKAQVSWLILYAHAYTVT